MRRYFVFLCAAMAALCSCGKNNGTDINPFEQMFDFKTSSEVTLNLDYGEMGAKSLVSIYSAYPFSEENRTDKEALYKVFLDENGTASETITLPDHVSEVYLVADNWTLPAAVSTEIKNGTISYSVKNESVATKAGVTTTAVASDIKVNEVSDKYKLWSVCAWDGKHGAINDINGIVSHDGKATPQLIRSLQYLLWNGKPNRENGIDNSHLFKANRGLINTAVTEDAEIWLTFIGECGWSTSAVGYYIYPSDNPPSGKDDVLYNLKKYILIPNASMAGNPPYMDKGSEFKANVPSRGCPDYGKDNATVEVNDRFQLIYVDDEGKASTVFPKGYTVGYFLLTRYCLNTVLDKEPYTVLEEDGELRDKKFFTISDEQAIVLQVSDGSIIYGFENGVDKNYDDLIFSVEATPTIAISNPDRNQFVIGDNVVSTKVSNYYTFLFEDLWPSKGDYDMNDVMVELARTSTFNSNGLVTDIEETYTITQPFGSAGLINAFANINATIYDNCDLVEQPEGTWSDLSMTGIDTKAMILFDNCAANIGKSVTLKYKVKSGVKLTVSEYMNGDDAFIIPGYIDNPSSTARKEVHTPSFKPTELIDHSLNAIGPSAYYLDMSGMYPFAMKITGEDPNFFVPVPEKKAIDMYYSTFRSWADSNGKNNKDWYRFPASE